MLSLTSRGKRSLTYSIIILLVLGIFASGYLLYFIPHNRAIIHKNGFQILKTISSSIENATAERVLPVNNLYRYSRGSGLDKIAEFKRQLIANNIYFDTIYKTRRPDSLFDFQITDRKFIINIKDSLPLKDFVIQYAVSIDKFLANLLVSQKTEFFSAYALQKITGKTSEIIYQDEELAIRPDLADSLLPKGPGSATAGIRDIVSENVPLKMFYYPFRIGNSIFILSGFAETEKYDKAIRKIPFYFIYPLLIIFLLLLIFYPVIKFHFMDSNEQLRVKDAIFFGLSAIIGTLLLTILIIQIFVWKADEKRVRNNLELISDQIKTAFNTELQKAFQEMMAIDSFKNQYSKNARGFSNAVKDFFHAQLKSDTGNANFFETGYFHFDRINWVDSSGWQVMKAELYKDPVFDNVADRNYFKVFKTGTPYLLPGNKVNAFGWEPLFSKTNGDYNITISLRSGKSIVAMATKMYSLVQTILPKGYGFCIINDKGVVQVHSDSNRNLRENLLLKVDKPAELMAAIDSRQFRTIDYVTAYGNLNMMVVQPLDFSMPFHLVCFYDEGNIAPGNLRILIFTLFLCFLYFIICIILWLCLARKGTADHPLLFSRMDLFDWATPKPQKNSLYFQGFLYMFFYALSIAAIALSHSYDSGSNSNILALLIITPLNIILVLNCMQAGFEQRAGSKAKVKKFVLVHIVISLLFYLNKGIIYQISWVFLLFQLIIAGLMCYSGFAEMNNVFYRLKPKFNFLINYKLLAFSLILSLAVLPASLFTWYAHNHEIIQGVKNEQLYLANAIRERMNGIRFAKPGSDTLFPKLYFNSLRFSYGIYKINEDVVSDTAMTALNADNFSDKNLYYNLAEVINPVIYKDKSYAALYDNAYDNSWKWAIEKKKIFFEYHPVLPGSLKEGKKERQNYLRVESNMPERFIYTKTNLVAIVLLVLMLLAGLYHWVGRKAEQIFLTRFIFSPKQPVPKIINHRISAFLALNTSPVNERLFNPSRYQLFSNTFMDDKLLEFEKEIVQDIYEGNKLYEGIWNNCSKKEKYLIYGFAREGVINYKSSKEIIGMMDSGLLQVAEDRMRLFSPGFRAYVLFSVDQEELVTLQKDQSQHSSWQYFQIPLMVFLTGVAVLIFITQEGFFDKILGIAGGVTTLVGLVTKVFTGSSVSSKIK